MAKTTQFKIAGTSIPLGKCKDIRLPISQRYDGETVTLPIRVIRGRRRGPVVYISAAVHGDELNGMGIIHDLMTNDTLQLKCGTVLLIPVTNIFGVESLSRYMPDRRDLNRCFPGSETGSLSRRFANVFFQEIVKRCDYGIDLHSAAAPRTNFPNIRADLNNTAVRKIAKAFGCELMINGKGPVNSLRREATTAGCPSITVEAGEQGKIEPSILEIGVRGILNVLRYLQMIDGDIIKPAYQTRVEKAVWVRAQVAGILRYHVAPGELIHAEQPVATNVSIFGVEQNVLTSPVDGIVLGMTTLPTVKPGEPVCHIAIPGRSLKAVSDKLDQAPDSSLDHRLRTDLATNINVSESEVEWAGENGSEDD